MADAGLGPGGITDGVTAEATDRVYALRDPTGTPLDRYITPEYIKDYILGLANTFAATQTITPAANTSGLVVSGYSLTGANAQPMIDLSGTWNTTGTPTAIFANITDTASNAASLLCDLQVGGSSKFSVRKTGVVVALDVQFGASGGTGLSVYKSGTLMRIDNSYNGGVLFGTGGLFAAGGGGAGGAIAALYLGASGSSSPAIHGVNFVSGNDPVVMELRQGTIRSELRVYDTRASTSDYHRVSIATARATLSSVSGASVTASGLIPAGAIVLGVTTKVTTALGTTNGTTGYQVGDGVDADRWADKTGTAAGTTTDNRDWTATTVQAFTAANDVVITANGGNFDGTGTIYVSVQYIIGECD